MAVFYHSGIGAADTTEPVVDTVLGSHDRVLVLLNNQKVVGMITVTLTERERLAVLFELSGALETVNKSIAAGETVFVGEDEMLMLLIAKFQDHDTD